MDGTARMTFEDTSVAFSYKTDRELRKANLIFSLVNHPWMSSVATGLAKAALNARLPVEPIIKKTVFQHFCGGETIAESETVIQTLWKYRVGTILDYSVEGEKSEEGFDRTMAELLRTIDKASTSGATPFSVFKPTGIISFGLLEKVQKGETLTADERTAFDRGKKRFDTICSRAFLLNVPVLVDAEETWIQDPIDAIVDELMAKYNRERAIVFNTYQLYRTQAFGNLRAAHANAVRTGYFLGAKLVRGAYMEKERDRAEELDYPSPIHPDKASTDKAFNDALLFCVENIDRISLMCGSHNERSNAFLADLMNERGIDHQDKRVWFAQLYGMSDNISFNLAKAGYNVAKYVPYGPVRAVMPYLLRRAAENTSVAGQSSRELRLIRKELRRRRNSH